MRIVLPRLLLLQADILYFRTGWGRRSKLELSTVRSTGAVWRVGTLCGFHTYVGADDMWVSCREAWVYAASLFCRHINVIKNSDFFVVYIWNMDHFGLWILYNVDCELGLYLLLIQWLSTNVYRCTPPARHCHYGQDADLVSVIIADYGVWRTVLAFIHNY